MFTNFDKAIIAPVVLAILQMFGVTGSMTVEELVGLIVAGVGTALAVYVTPNKVVE